MRFRLSIIASLAGWLAVTAAAAQAPPSPYEPAGPTALTREVLEPWMAANVRAEGWRPIGANEINEFLAPAAFVKSADGKVRTQIRLERFQPAELQGFVWRSAVQGVEFDCPANVIRFQYLSAFPGLNLQGSARRFELGTPAPLPTTEVPALGQIHQLACTAPPRQWPTQPTPPAALRQTLQLAWLADNIEHGDWRLASISTASATFTHPKVGVTADGWREAVIRSEFFKPEIGPQGVPRRSEVLAMHIDCVANRIRVISVTTYLQQNLLGPVQVLRGPPDWQVVPDRSPAAAAVFAACPPPAGPPAPR